MAEWFHAKVKFLRQMDNGLIKKVTEQYLVDSLSFTETEARVMQEAGEGMREVTMIAVSRSPIKEVVMYGDTDLFFTVKVKYSTVDEVIEKERKVTMVLLVNANDVKEAYERTESHLKDMLVPFQITKVEESPIVEVFQHIPNVKSRAQDDAGDDDPITTVVTKEMVDNLEKMAVGNWLDWYSDKYECGVDEAEIAYVDTARESRNGPPSDESAIFGSRKTTGIAMIPPLKDMG